MVFRGLCLWLDGAMVLVLKPGRFSGHSGKESDYLFVVRKEIIIGEPGALYASNRKSVSDSQLGWPDEAEICHA